MKVLKYILPAIILFFVATDELYAQAKVLSGKVTELFGGKVEPMMGVNINILNTQNRSVGGTITNLEGTYNLQIPNEPNLTITFSYIGKKTERIKYNGQTRLDVTLKDDSQTMDDVVITADRLDRNNLGLTAREQVSATQVVKMDELVAVAPVTSLEDALQGQLSGVDIVLGGGDPGARASIQIRGTSTLNANTDPLIVIDGIPYETDTDDTDFSNLNNEDLGALLNISPQDIESIEVLKDAAATAIWGTKGANGVLSITTKTGAVGKTRFSFSSKFSAKFEPESIPMLNGDEYTALLGEAIWNSANYIGLENSSSYLQLLYNSPEIGFDRDWEYFDEYNQDTDWLGEIRRNTQTWENNFSMNGGGERATYRFALGYLNEGGTTIGTGFSRLNASLKVSYRFSDKLKFDADFSFTQSDRDANWCNIRNEAFRKMPNKSPYYIDDETGLRMDQYFSHTENSTIDPAASINGSSKDKSKGYNPVALGKEGINNTLQREERMNFRAEYKILPGFTYSGYVSFNIKNSKGRMFLPQVATGLPWTDEWANRSSDASSDQLTLQTENKLLYIKNWKERHNLIANLIFRTNNTTKSSYGAETSGNASSDLSDPVVESTLQTMSSGESETRSYTGTAALNYTLLNRYVFNVTGSMEGNSSMGKSERWGFFPSAGVAWHLKEEKFLREVEWLNDLKLRFSAGQSGKSASGYSLYLGTYGSGDNYMGMDAIKPTSMQLNNLKWETTTEYNTGFDVGFFKNRLRFTFDVYQKFTKDLLQKDVKQPTTTGYGDNYKIKFFNSGQMTNKGWEFRTDFVALENKDLRLAGYFNISRNENKITEMPDNYTIDNYTFDNGNYATRYEVGRPLGSFFGYRYLGVYQNQDATYARDADNNIMKDMEGNPIVMKNGSAQVAPGDAIYEDINHDGVINEYDIVYLGNAQPLFTYGAGLNISYKQFKLSAVFFGRYGMKVVNKARMDNESMYGVNNQSTAVLKRWRNEGDITDIPRALYNEGYNYLGSDRFVEDASFLRLKTLSLTYTLPKNVCQRWGLTNANVYVTGYNLFTWTKYTGQDPEVKPNSKLTQDTALTPVSTQFTCGLNLSF